MIIGELKEFIDKLNEQIKDLPLDSLVLIDDPHSEFTFDISIRSSKSFTKIDHTPDRGEVYYESWAEEDFADFLSDNPDEEEELKLEYKPSLVLYLE